jgi:SAM-dependent methyltransferase
MLESAGATPRSPIIDVGGGAARLVDHLLARGYESVTVLDISNVALDQSRRRLGQAAERAQWIVADVLEADLPQAYEVWHDRAVFHFLTDPDERRRYASKLYHALTPGGHAIITTFAEDGPEKCSGLPCARYSPKALHAELGADRFRQVDSVRETHVTPKGQEQRFQYSLLQKVPC